MKKNCGGMARYSGQYGAGLIPGGLVDRSHFAHSVLGVGDVPEGQMGPGGLIGLVQPGSGETDTEQPLGDLSSILSQQSAMAGKRKKPMDWQSMMQAGLIGAMAGGLGGNKGLIAGPLTVLMQQLLKGKFGQASTSGKTPPFVSTDPYGSGE